MEYKNYVPLVDGCIKPVKTDNGIIEPEIYLHGCCDKFMVVLAEHMKEQSIPFCILVIADEQGLIHTGIVVDGKDMDEHYFIDARGITSDECVFFGEFEDFYIYNDWLCDGYFFRDIETAKKFIYGIVGPEESAENYWSNMTAEAEEIFTVYKKYYTLPYGLWHN